MLHPERQTGNGKLSNCQTDRKCQPTSSQQHSEANPGPGTFEDGHVDDGADLRHLILGCSCWRLRVVAAPPAESGRRSGGGGDAANQREEQKQPHTSRQHDCHNLRVEWNREEEEWRRYRSAEFNACLSEVTRKTNDTHGSMWHLKPVTKNPIPFSMRKSNKLNWLFNHWPKPNIFGVSFVVWLLCFFHIPVQNRPSVKIFPDNNSGVWESRGSTCKTLQTSHFYTIIAQGEIHCKIKNVAMPFFCSDSWLNRPECNAAKTYWSVNKGSQCSQSCKLAVNSFIFDEQKSSTPHLCLKKFSGNCMKPLIRQWQCKWKLMHQKIKRPPCSFMWLPAHIEQRLVQHLRGFFPFYFPLIFKDMKKTEAWRPKLQTADCFVTLEFSYGIQRSLIKKYNPSSLRRFERNEGGSYATFHMYTHTLCTPGLHRVWKHQPPFDSLCLNSEEETLRHTFPRTICAAESVTLGTPLLLIQIHTHISLYAHSDTPQTRRKEKIMRSDKRQ